MRYHARLCQFALNRANHAIECEISGDFVAQSNVIECINCDKGSRSSVCGCVRVCVCMCMRACVCVYQHVCVRVRNHVLCAGH